MAGRRRHPRCRASRMSSRASRVLPIPGSPPTRATPPWPVSIQSSSRRSSVASASRPTNGVRSDRSTVPPTALSDGEVACQARSRNASSSTRSSLIVWTRSLDDLASIRWRSTPSPGTRFTSRPPDEGGSRRMAAIVSAGSARRNGCAPSPIRVGARRARTCRTGDRASRRALAQATCKPASPSGFQHPSTSSLRRCRSRREQPRTSAWRDQSRAPSRALAGSP